MIDKLRTTMLSVKTTCNSPYHQIITTTNRLISNRQSSSTTYLIRTSTEVEIAMQMKPNEGNLTLSNKQLCNRITLPLEFACQ